MAERKYRFTTNQPNTSFTTANPQCSCPKCDSLQCFAKRQVKDPCSCQKCENSKTCLNFPHKMSKCDELTNKIKSTIEGDDVTRKERVKREITYEFMVNSTSVTNNIKKTFASNSKNFENINTNNAVEYQSTDTNTAAVNILRKDHALSVAKLSAQVMNLPDQDIHDDISNEQSNASSYRISAYDVLKRIRDAYKACSCKVCECLVGKSLTIENKSCKCKPCDCNDCMSFLTKFQYLERIDNQPPYGCPCIRCTRSQCTGLSKNNTNTPPICDCPPYNCTKCPKNFTKSCKCEPCQCLECKATSIHVPRTIVVAPVGEQHQHNYCQCTPCECITCGGYGMPSSYMREAATDVNRHPRCHCEVCSDDACIPDSSESCKCERRSKVVTKPLEKDVRDYDIRAMVTSEKPLCIAKSKPLRNSTIALYATVPNLYRSFENRKDCSCSLCECVVCNCKENAVDSIKSSQLFKDPYEQQRAFNLNTDTCKCSLCECQICSKKEYEYDIMTRNCKCETCNCLSCQGLTKVDSVIVCPYIYAMRGQSTKDLCTCGPCECVDCNKTITCAGDVCSCAICACKHCIQESKESIYPIKKAEVLTPYSFNNEISKGKYIRKHNSSEDNSSNTSDVELYDCFSETTSHRDILSYHAHPQTFRLAGNMQYIFPPERKTILHPKTENITKFLSTSNRKSFLKYKTPAHSSNVSKESYENYKTESKSNESPGPLPLNVVDNNDHQRVTPTFIGRKLCLNSRDSGCSSLDYCTILPELGREMSKVGNQRNQEERTTGQLSQNTNEFNYKEVIINNSSGINALDCNKYGDENQDHPHHSFESDNKKYFAIDLGNDKKITSSKQIFDQQYWIKNVDVSLKLNEPIFYNSSTKFSADNRSRKDFINNEPSNNALESDKSTILRNVGDYSLHSYGKQVKDIFNNEAYYEGVQKTLHRAREFSTQLMKILDKYEKANNEFQSITQKLKISHASSLNKDLCYEDGSMNNSRLNVRQSEQDCAPEKDTYLKDNSNKQETPAQFYLNNCLQAKTLNEQGTQVNILLSNNQVFCYSNSNLLELEKLKNNEEFFNLYKDKEGKKTQSKWLTSPHRKVRRIHKSKRYSPRILKKIIIVSKGGHSAGVSKHTLKLNMSTQTQCFLDTNEQHINTNASSRNQFVPMSTKSLTSTSCQAYQEINYMCDLKNKPMLCKSSKSCCDALKVNFQSLQRVSDHTVLVKWTVPRVTTDVTGYELLVDGRAVQKILSPSRCVAVITCLPHCDTILLTIRTIASLTPSGHYPSSTVVYHPRAK